MQEKMALAEEKRKKQLAKPKEQIKLEKTNEALAKENTELKAQVKAAKAYSDFLQEKYQVLWNCTELLPKAVAQQLAIINLNVGEWTETEQFYEIKLPEVFLKVPKWKIET
jgi:hypothetical protein